MPAGDQLAIVLFWLSLAAVFGVEFVNAESRPRRIGFGAVAGLCLVLGFFWPLLKGAWPPFTEKITAIATNPQTWFTIAVLVAAIIIFQRQKGTRQPNLVVSIPKPRKTRGPWLTSYKILEFADAAVLKDVKKAAENYQKWKHDYEKLKRNVTVCARKT